MVTIKKKNLKKRIAKPKPSVRQGVYATPILGILTHPLRIPKTAPPKIIRNNFRELVLAGQRMGMTVYVFVADGVAPDGRTVRGITLERVSGKYIWKETVFPLPDVVYNRIPNRRFEILPPVRDVLRSFRDHYHIPIFNPHFIDKWTLNEWLSKDQKISAYVPETVRFSATGLKQMLKRHSEVYIKPSNGSLGRGIIKVSPAQSGYVCIRQIKGRFCSIRYRSLEKLTSGLKRVIRNQPYMIQQALPLATYHGSGFDIRTLVQKDGNGDWQLTGMAVRASKAGAHVTHVVNGGYAVPLRKALLHVTQHNEPKTEALLERLFAFARMLPARLEAASGMRFGEFSFDIGLSRDSSIWIIEANAKPFKFDEDEIRLVSRRRVLEYAAYLCRQIAGVKEKVIDVQVEGGQPE
ncbi:MAG: YheC/YheD family protein [Solirubrobacterales bacterium]